MDDIEKITESLVSDDTSNTNEDVESTSALIAVYQECHSIRREAESRESRVALGTSALILAFTSYLLKNIAPLDNVATLFAVGMIFLISAVSFWFLFSNGLRLTYCLRIIVRIETALGLYKPSHFEHLEEDNKSLFPKNAQKWGIDTKQRVAIWQHISLVAIISVASGGSLFMSNHFITNNKTPPANELTQNKKNVATSELKPKLDIKKNKELPEATSKLNKNPQSKKVKN